MLPIKVPKDFCIIAHRGASAYAPENTAPAFALAKKMGISEVEVDAQLSTDGVVVLCHDKTLERYGHGSEVVEEQTIASLEGLDMGSWFSPYFFSGTPLLTLEQLLTRFGSDFRFHIELKGVAVGLAAAVDRLVRTMGCVDRVVYTSFSYHQLQRMRSCAPESRLGWLVQNMDRDVLDKARQLGLYQLCPRADNTSPDQVRLGGSAVENIRAWGISGSPQQIQALIRQVVASGCSGMTINWPDWVIHQPAKP